MQCFSLYWLYTRVFCMVGSRFFSVLGSMFSCIEGSTVYLLPVVSPRYDVPLTVYCSSGFSYIEDSGFSHIPGFNIWKTSSIPGVSFTPTYSFHNIEFLRRIITLTFVKIPSGIRILIVLLLRSLSKFLLNNTMVHQWTSLTVCVLIR